MYRQIEIDPSQRDLQLILWRDEKGNDVNIYRLNTVTYGTASAPFLATRCLLQLAKECSDDVIANVIQNDFYMDDLITGCDSVDGLRYIFHGVVDVLRSACMPLRKFRSNYPQLFENEADALQSMDLCREANVLGLTYHPKLDTLQFSTNLDLSREITKRTIISNICKVFDPLGLLCPCIIIAKILLQNLWSAKLDWDEVVPKELAKSWSGLVEDFHTLSDIKISRRVFCDGFSVDMLELHCFVDASQRAYAACVYIRSSNEGKFFVKLLCAKARVAPIKPTTIPRLELNGALLGARLSKKVLEALRCNIAKKFMWTDSTVVLGWLKTQPKDLKTYVCNRVNEINELTPGFTFNHVPTIENPADMASRGVNPTHLKSSSLWWEGPAFLRSEPGDWPGQSYSISNILPELKATKTSSELKNLHITMNYDGDFIQFKNFSNLNRLKRVYCYVLRFINNCRKQNDKVSGPLSVTELNRALNILCKFSQRESFDSEIKLILSNRPLPRNSKLLPLTPFIDPTGVMRVQGRLDNSGFGYDKKHPIILDAKHYLTKLFMVSEHLRLFHAGPQLLLASVRERIWPIGGRNLARSTVRQCVVCTRYKGKTLQPIMGNLPAERSEQAFPFSSCGVDMAGPFMISSRKGRGNRISKCYLCLFVCLATKAVHLELVSDLTTESFILALRRFISRRGRPYVIFCDNGTNFKGANSVLKRLLRSSRFCDDEGIEFKFSPAYSPHFGGIWEAGIKSAKHHLKRVAGNASLTFEELATLFAQIEGILNSRPLSPLSADPRDPSPLTPGHFLIGRAITSLPSVPINCKNVNRYERLEQLRQHFWDRWRREYIAELQQRTRWRVREAELREGDLVLLKEEHLPPMNWRLARVDRLHPGGDGVSRVADVLTSQGIIRRAVNRMVKLPSPQDLESITAFNEAEDVHAEDA
ncbi:unnamed protein product [Euphydryas editha]|uniref:Integrase catalytic domain-containing protein n=1 Tax=Euphydryas editha TaxID=104508 RepID=A0AAU9U2L6_EUPED|nr:unnamed protein product [Euphydryas editha]